MRLRYLFTAIGAWIIVQPGIGNAQVQQGNGASPYAPNYYNRSTQPLSPYLNMLRGNNSAVNYFYGVRPGSATGPLSSPFSMSPGTQGRQTFFPQLDTLIELEDTKPTDGIRPTGHPFGFNNGMGYFGSSGRQSGQQQGTGVRRGTGLR